MKLNKYLLNNNNTNITNSTIEDITSIDYKFVTKPSFISGIIVRVNI